jgi:methyl-accepting chemotaxis protein
MASWTISRRIAAGFVALVLLAVVIGGVSMWRMLGINGHVVSLSTNVVPSMATLSRIIQSNVAAVRAVSAAVLGADDAVALADAARTFDAAVAGGSRLCVTYREALISDDKDRDLFTAAVAARDAMLVESRNVLQLVAEGRATEARELLESKVEPQVDTCLDLFDRDIAHMLELSEREVDGARDKLARGVGLVGILAAAAAAVGSLLGFAIIRWTGQALRSISAALGDSVTQTAAAAAALATVSGDLATGSGEQGAAVAETSASLEEMSAMIKSTADNAAQAKELAAEARAAAEAGARTMAEMNAAMTAIEASSAEVAKIVKDIDELAFQTNILALNAAVEAARAGDAGAGFAVVADEVRSLAQRSAAAARATAEKIEAAIASSRHGAASCDRVGDSLGEIAGKVTAADQLVAEIATAAREQAQGIRQIGAAMSQLDRVTQENATRAVHGATASTQLSSQARVMQENVTWLRSLVTGGRVPAPAAGLRRSAGAHRTSRPPGARLPARGPRPAAPRIPMPGDESRGHDAEDRHFRDF